LGSREREGRNIEIIIFNTISSDNQKCGESGDKEIELGKVMTGTFTCVMILLS
jgi:hypothetical protein